MSSERKDGKAIASKTPTTQSYKELQKLSRQNERNDTPPPEHSGWRPRVRADCATFPRPCPFVGCKFHLFLEVGQAGSIKYNFGEDITVLKDMNDTCALDVAERGGVQLATVGDCLNVTRERVRQQAEVCMNKLSRVQPLALSAEHD